ncbi:RNA polymerase sigma-70 factor [Chitinophagaceae bacterium LB-8]|uniref:RNA polymerase sigma-70 factor n=1 Tax=Paraflavisolibacter caeni TaxID=2982496 RepID=A0A9X2XMU7_9BACT|nr:RNA polymerase sigma-70 factor [Paraflavisolibacter caeni]MCU7547978.1 RNA polymerase sigma-70 factor [Paraflavisolibacter caeni]
MDKNALSDDRLLLQQIAEGHEKAFAVLVSRYWNNIYGQALTYLKSSHQAQDIVQEVFIKIWEKRETLPQIERFDSFLFITARNHIISELRKKLANPLDPDVVDVYKEERVVPDQQLSFKQLQQHLKTAVELLPQQQKTAFLLSRDEGLSYEAIAAQMNLSRETVKKHIGRSLNFLRTYMRTHAEVNLTIFFIILLNSVKF